MSNEFLSSTIITSSLFFISEIMPFLPIKSNGLVHTIMNLIKNFSQNNSISQTSNIIKNGDWNSCIDKITGKTYYVNNKTMKIQWDKPKEWVDKFSDDKITLDEIKIMVDELNQKLKILPNEIETILNKPSTSK